MNGGDIMFGLGMQEMLLIGLVLLLLFGPSKIPELMRSVGKGITEFKRGVTEAKDAVQLDERMKP